VRGLTVDQYGSADLFVQGVLWNCSARIEKNHMSGVLEPKGNCTEIGLIKYLMAAGISVQDIIREKEGKILQTIPFNSRRKRASTTLSLNSKDNSKVRVFLKGAPEIVIEYCNSYFDASGTK
jgi:magnesium-transporting ATPase (P-type)